MGDPAVFAALLLVSLGLVGVYATVVPTRHYGGLRADDECFSTYPNQYVARRVTSPPVIDGLLDDDAWAAAPWSSLFVDIADSDKEPYYDTQAKILWDDDCLYVGMLLEDQQAWANLTEHNSIIFYDNDIEVFVDPDGDTHYYKEIEFNARAVDWNLILVKPYLNGGPAVCNATVEGQCSLSAPEYGIQWWDVENSLKAAAHVEGALNDPATGTQWWSLEACLPVAEYTRYEAVPSPPQPGDLWRINFSRVQWHIHVDAGGYYAKDPGVPEENWVWQPTGVVNMHLPERWGYVQFAGSSGDPEEARDPAWPVRGALAAVYAAEQAYGCLYGVGYTEDVGSLVENAGLGEDVASGVCAGVPAIAVTDQGGFEVQVKSLDGSLIGTIDEERLTTIQSV